MDLLTQPTWRTRILNLIQALIWALFILSPILFSLESASGTKVIHVIRFIWPMVFAMLIYYLNYGYLIRKFLFEQKFWQFLLINLLVMAVSLYILQTIHEVYLQPPHDEARPLYSPPPTLFIFFRNFFTLTLFAGLSVAIKVTARWYRAETELKDLARMHLESELNQLKSQINPHFLFNTLNNIYSLVAISQENAQQAIHQLSKLMRYVLYESQLQETPLHKEIEFLRSYIKLMSLRLPSHVDMDVNLPESTQNQLIAPLLLMPLVENAFKHGVKATLPSRISILLEIQDDTLILRVQNSIFPKKETDPSGSGIGLGNLKKRLDLIYPKKNELSLSPSASQYEACLKLNLS
ncbi:MAG: histidine kinase [Bacteroidetes bacterium]|nr:histidine kinase [Bacteroidota bacterium]